MGFLKILVDFIDKPRSVNSDAEFKNNAGEVAGKV